MPDENRFTDNWGLHYDDYRRAIALQAHFTNKYGTGIDAVLIDAADNGRVHQTIVAMLDLNELLMPQMGEPVIVQKMQELAALWAGKNQGDIHD